jgi:hypothetical protein
MERLDFTLLTDGSADAILIEPITWLLRQHLSISIPINGTWADLRRLPKPPKDLRNRIQVALELYPCDLLFVHRDAEGEPHERRIKEITAAVAGLANRSVPIVPVRMQEAWLLINERALRIAAGNPNGRIALEMPAIERLEKILNPKQVLHDLLLSASELTGRRRQKLKPGEKAMRLGALIEDYGPLRCLSAFREVETATLAALRDGNHLNRGK